MLASIDSYRLHPLPVRAGIVAESATGNRRAVPGALGSMQPVPATARRFGVVHPADPVRYMASGARYWRRLLTRHGGDATRRGRWPTILRERAWRSVRRDAALPGNPEVRQNGAGHPSMVAAVGRHLCTGGVAMMKPHCEDHPYSILVAHGAEEVRIVLKTALKDAGYHHVAIAANGRQIFERLKRNNFNLLITALDLPGINCWQLLRVIATGAFCSPRLPLLIVCNTNQIPLIEPLAHEHHARLLALDELARLPIAVAACIDGPIKSTILVIEDHLKTAELIQLSLQTGFAVEIALTGEAGLTAWRARQHHLVLLDLMLPGLNGSEVLQQIIAEKPDQLVAIITARSERQTHQNLMLAGAAAFLPKPVDLNTLPYFCEGLLHYGACLSQRARLEPQQEFARHITERVQVVKFLLETGQTGRAAEYIKHTLARRQSDPLRDDEWTKLLSEFD